jgi:hypothetical protein
VIQTPTQSPFEKREKKIVLNIQVKTLPVRCFSVTPQRERPSFSETSHLLRTLETNPEFTKNFLLQFTPTQTDRFAGNEEKVSKNV